MKKILFITIAFVCCSCGSGYYLKRAKWNTLKAIALGAKIDSLKTVVHDTINFKTVTDSAASEARIDTVILQKICPEAKTPEKRSALQKAICPNVALDSVYKLPVYVEGKKYFINLHVMASSIAAKVHYKMEIKGAAIPYEKKTISPISTPSNSLTWFHLIIIGLAGLVVGFVVGKLLK